MLSPEARAEIQAKITKLKDKKLLVVQRFDTKIRALEAVLALEDDEDDELPLTMAPPPTRSDVTAAQAIANKPLAGKGLRDSIRYALGTRPSTIPNLELLILGMGYNHGGATPLRARLHSEVARLMEDGEIIKDEDTKVYRLSETQQAAHNERKSA